jgi:hypothetical protein
MILKIMTSKTNVPRTNGEGDFWRVFADVAGLQYGKQLVPAYPEPPIEEDDVNRYHWVSAPAAAEDDKVLGMFLSFFEDGDPVEVYSNHAIYLMNDNGKTIEQLF